MTDENQYLYVTTVNQTYNYVVFRGYDLAETYHESPEIALAAHPENTVFYLTGSGYGSYVYEPEIETLTYYFETKNPARIQYAYLRDGVANNGWPGVVMDTLGTDGEGVRTYRITFNSHLWTEIRFINNNSSILTEYVSLLDYPNETIFYEIANVVDGYPYGTERPYEIPDVEYPNTMTYFFETQVAADDYFAYFWRSGTNNTWPGYTMVYEGTFGGYMLYSTELTPDYWYNAIFSCTDKVVKTPTIELRDAGGNWIYPDGTVFYYKNATVGSYLFGDVRPYSLPHRELILPPRLFGREEGVN